MNISSKHGRAARAITAGLLAGAMALGTVAPAFAATVDYKTGAEAPTTTTAMEYGKGKITINNYKAKDGHTTGENTTTFKGYLIFRANVRDGVVGTVGKQTGKNEQNVQWYSDAVEDAVEGVIKAADPVWYNQYENKNGATWRSDGSKTGHVTAQDAADWIQAHADEGFHTGTDDKGNDIDLTKATDAVKNHTWVASGTIADSIAHAIDATDPTGELTTQATVTAGVQTELDEGWWLFTSTDSSMTTQEAGTSPIFAVVGGSAVSVSEKTKTPQSVKMVKNDADGSVWDYVSDSQRGQEVNYKIIGTVSGNVKTFDSYFYAFHDSLSKGLDFVDGSVVVKAYNNTIDADSDLDGTSGTVGYIITNSFAQSNAKDATSGNTQLDLTCNDLKATLKNAGTELTDDTVVVVYYKAKLNDDCVVGLGDPADPANPNKAYVEYSQNPYSKQHGQTVPTKPRDYTYKFLLNKVDRDTEVKLQGEHFTIQALVLDDKASEGKYVQADGTYADTPYEFVTDADGQFSVDGLDAGKYLVHEVSAPAPYTTIDDFTFTIEPTYKASDGTERKTDGATGAVSTALAMAADETTRYNGQWLAELDTTVVGKEGDVIAGITDGITGDNKLVAAADNKATDITTGQVQVTVGDVKHVELPFTGEQGVTFAFAIAAAGVAVSVVALKNRKNEDAEDAE